MYSYSTWIPTSIKVTMDLYNRTGTPVSTPQFYRSILRDPPHCPCTALFYSMVLYFITPGHPSKSSLKSLAPHVFPGVGISSTVWPRATISQCGKELPWFSNLTRNYHDFTVWPGTTMFLYVDLAHTFVHLKYFYFKNTSSEFLHFSSNTDYS